jgi:hypothetical protein
MQFEEEYAIMGPIRGAVTIARGHGIRQLANLRSKYGPGRWRKCKGFATVVVLRTGDVVEAELHWYEANGIGRRDFKMKREPWYE